MTNDYRANIRYGTYYQTTLSFPFNCKGTLVLYTLPFIKRVQLKSKHNKKLTTLLCHANKIMYTNAITTSVASSQLIVNICHTIVQSS